MKDANMKKNRSLEDQAMLERLVNLSDEDIDTVDIPEAPAENWAFAKRPGLYRPVSATSPCGSTPM